LLEVVAAAVAEAVAVFSPKEIPPAPIEDVYVDVVEVVFSLVPPKENPPTPMDEDAVLLVAVVAAAAAATIAPGRGVSRATHWLSAGQQGLVVFLLSSPSSSTVDNVPKACLRRLFFFFGTFFTIGCCVFQARKALRMILSVWKGTTILTCVPPIPLHRILHPRHRISCQTKMSESIRHGLTNQSQHKDTRDSLFSISHCSTSSTSVATFASSFASTLLSKRRVPGVVGRDG